jgi:hypothetical protein
MTTPRLSSITAASALVLACLTVTSAQTPGTSPSELASQLRERYDIVGLSQGVALVPRESGGVRLIQIVDGSVSLDGEIVTGRELRSRLGADADLVLQVSYLDPGAQRQLSGTQPDAVESASQSPAGVEPASPEIERTQVRRGDIVRFGGDVSVDVNERVQGDVVVMGGSADVDGEVSGDVTVIGGTARLGPQAIIRRDLNVIGGRLNRAPGARVVGDLNEVGTGEGFSWGGADAPRMWGFRESGLGRFWSRMGSLAGTILRIALVALVALVAFAFGSRQIERVAARTAAEPLRAGLVGLVAEILFTPVLVLTVIVLAVSIVGIPLLALVPFGILLVMLVMLVGFIGLSYQVGRLIMAKIGRADSSGYATVALGILAVGSLTLFAKLAALAGGAIVGVPLIALGYFVEYVAWTVGFGAALMAWYESQRRFSFSGGSTSTAPVGDAS